MNKYTADCYEMKRESVKFSNILTKNCSKPTQGFFTDMIYGIAASKDLKISNIARELKEEENIDKRTKLCNTVERICLHLDGDINNVDDIKEQYRKYVRTMIPDDVKVIFDNSDITKIYGKKFEYLDEVIDASDPKKEVKPGYPVVNAMVLSKNKKQPIPIYSKIVSTKAPGFKSMNNYTYESIDEAYKTVGGKFLGIFDRGYDDKKIFRYLDSKRIDFIIRLKGNRSFLFKGISKNVLKQANTRKGKIVFNAKFRDEEKTLTISYTKANLTDGDKEEYTLVFVYGLGNEPMMLITNKKINNAHDARVIVRLYLERWKIEEIHRAEKVEYNYEDIRVRSLKSLNNLNMIFMMYLGFLAKLADGLDYRLLSLKIMERSKSLREELVVYIGMMARGIQEILSYAHTGIQKYKHRGLSKQMSEEERLYIKNSDISEQLGFAF